MTTAPLICPYCGASHHRELTDHKGTVGWCQDCHRTWEFNPVEPPLGLDGEHGADPQLERRMG